MVAPEYLLAPAFQLPLEERYALAQVGDSLVFGVQQGVHARLQVTRGLADGDPAGGQRGRFAVVYRGVFVLWLYGCRARRFLPAGVFLARGILGPRETLWAYSGGLGAIHRRWAVSTLNNPYGYLPARCTANLRRHSLDLAVTKHLPDAVGRELEGPCCLLDCVEILALHGGSIHPVVPPTP